MSAFDLANGFEKELVKIDTRIAAAVAISRGG